jgi:hypothetical protein
MSLNIEQVKNMDEERTGWVNKRQANAARIQQAFEEPRDNTQTKIETNG